MDTKNNVLDIRRSIKGRTSALHGEIQKVVVNIAWVDWHMFRA